MPKGFDPYNPEQLSQLLRSVNNSRQDLEHFRVHRHKLIQEYIGSFYENKTEGRRAVPVNAIELAMTIYTTHLAAQNPAVHFTAKKRQFKRTALGMGLALNEVYKETDFEDTLQDVVMDALLLMGVIRVGIDDDLNTYAKVVDMDDWVHDTNAKRWDDCLYYGNRYRMIYDQVMDDDRYDKKAKEVLSPGQNFEYNEDGYERVETLSRDESKRGPEDEWYPHVELYDLFVPQLKALVTVAAPEYYTEAIPMSRPLRVVTHDGPDKSPYFPLSFHRVPNNIVPVSPLGLRRDLHDLANNIFRKIDRQTRRSKTVTGYRKQGKKDAQAVEKAIDGAMIAMDNPDDVREFRYGGPDRELVTMLAYTLSLFSHDSGNLDALGGLQAQAPTLGQEELITTSASKRVAFMQGRTVNFVRKVSLAMAWYEWTDPVRRRLLSRTLPNSTVEQLIDWAPETRSGDFLEHELHLEPYSMQHQSPGAKLNNLMRLWTNVILPSRDELLRQNLAPDFLEFFKQVKHLGNLPEIESIVKPIDGHLPEEIEPRYSEEPRQRQSPVTTRNQVRYNQPGSTRTAQDALIASMFSGENVQNAEAQQLLRPTGRGAA